MGAMARRWVSMGVVVWWMDGEEFVEGEAERKARAIALRSLRPRIITCISRNTVDFDF